LACLRRKTGTGPAGKTREAGFFVRIAVMTPSIMILSINHGDA